MQRYLNGNKDKIICQNGNIVAYETGLCVLLYRFSHPSFFRNDMERIFCIRKTQLASIMKTFSTALHRYCLPYFSDPAIFFHHFPLYAHLIYVKSNGAASNIWGFIDGTLRKTVRPSRFQRMFYSGHKRAHGIKFQSVVTPDGLIACLFGPVAGNWHDAFVIGVSGKLVQLAKLMPVGHPVFTLYGNTAYAQMQLVLGGF
jgi:nuclease HARBI1